MNGYQPGQRIARVSTSDLHTRLQPGDTGTVLRHDLAHHTVHITWDSGSRLAMCLDAGDRIRELPPTAGEAESAGDQTGWTTTLQQLRAMGTEAGHHVADEWAQKALGGQPAERAEALRRYLLAGIDTADAGVLAQLPTFSPPLRWGARDMAEVRYTEAVHDSTHLLPADAAPSPTWAELSADQRAQTIAASREGFDTTVRQRVGELLREQDAAATDLPATSPKRPDAGPLGPRAAL